MPANPIELVARLQPLIGHADYLRRIAKPRVNIVIADAPPPQLSGSRFGGHPFAPRDFVWPSHETGRYRFLGQIDFAEVSACLGDRVGDGFDALPDSGLLALFYAEDEEGEVFWGDDGYVIGAYWPCFDDHAPCHAPDGKAPKSRALRFSPGTDLPQHEELREDWPFGEDGIECLATEAPSILGNGEDYLLGYPSFYSLAYDPTPKESRPKESAAQESAPGEGWISFLTLRSHDRFDWCWHDGDKLMIFIESEKLRARDFRCLKTDAG
jgi:uncharacterized protein YwqG